jgi:integrase
MAATKRGNNEGAISKKPNGKWRAWVTIDSKRPSKTFATRKECQDWIREMLNKYDLGYSPVTGKRILKDYLEEWMQRHAREIKESTASQYRYKIRKFVLPYIGDKKLEELTLPFMDRYYEMLLREGFGNRSVRYVHQILHKAFADAVKYGYIIRNPAHGATLPRIPQKEMQNLDAHQASTFLIAAMTSKLEALFYLALVTGMRQGELFGLKWDDLQWKSGALHVKRQASPYPGSRGGIHRTENPGGSPQIWGSTSIIPPHIRRPRRDSNPQPPDSKSVTLSIELRGLWVAISSWRAHYTILKQRLARTSLSCQSFSVFLIN